MCDTGRSSAAGARGCPATLLWSVTLGLRQLLLNNQYGVGISWFEEQPSEEVRTSQIQS